MNLTAATLIVSTVCITGAVIAGEAPTLSLSATSMTGVAGSNNQSAKVGFNDPSSYSASNQFVVDFVPGTKGVAGINFDVVVDTDSKADSVQVVACGAGIGKTHIVQCKQVAPNRIRVLIFSAPVEQLGTAEALKFEVKGGAFNARIDRESVAVSDMSGAVIQAEII